MRWHNTHTGQQRVVVGVAAITNPKEEMSADARLTLLVAKQHSSWKATNREAASKHRRHAPDTSSCTLFALLRDRQS